MQPIGLLFVRYIKTKRQVRNMTSAERDKVWAVRHEWGGEKVHSLVLDMSGFYVKSAQILATKAVSNPIRVVYSVWFIRWFAWPS